MNIFKKLIKKKENDVKIHRFETVNGETISIHTKVDLDDDHKDAIFKIIETGINSRTELNNIPIAIMMATGIQGTMSLERLDNEIRLKL